MRPFVRHLIALSLSISGSLALAQSQPAPAKPAILFVPVDGDVKLEVVNWGGTGTPIVLLAALGADAHEFDGFAPKLTGKGHVYGITRRGFGASSHPAGGYSNDRLGADIVAVLDSLKLDRVILAGHSIAGMELSWMGTRHPERILGLVYIEAAYGYAYYDPSTKDPTNIILDALELQKKLPQLPPGGGRPDQQRLTGELLSMVVRLEADLRARAEELKGPPEPEIDPAHPPQPPAWLTGIYQGFEKYTKLNVPVLAIYAVPHALDNLGDPDALSKDPKAAAKAEADDVARTGSQADAFEKGVPGSVVVRIPHASHFIFSTNEAEVLGNVTAFVDRLSKTPTTR